MSTDSLHRFAPTDPSSNLGLLADLVGTWAGDGFNLIARPDFHDKTDLYLQLNQTREHLQFTAIGSPVPNRGFGQDDIDLYGLTYLQKITDSASGGALHIEPGIWIVQPDTSFPNDNADPGQLIARMSTIPHGNAILAQGIAEKFTGPPVLSAPGGGYSFSRFPSFNSTPFGTPPFPGPPAVPPPPSILISADGSSEKATATALNVAPFPQYDLTIPVGAIPAGPLNPPFALNTRSPFGSNPPEPVLPTSIAGVALQDIVNDPIRLLQAEVNALVKSGHEFSGVALNVATTTPVAFLTTPNAGPTGHIDTVSVPQFSGAIGNIRFLTGETINAQPQENAQTALVYATFWIETVTHPATKTSFLQLQYAQMVVLEFPIFHLLHQPVPAYVNLGWPHVSVGTLRRSFG